MTVEYAWKLISDELMIKTRDFQTVPSNNRKPVWFHAKFVYNRIVIDKANHNTPSCRLKEKRNITYKDFANIFSYFLMWRNDSSIRKEIKNQSMNTAYIFAIIANICENKMIISLPK